MEFPLTQEQREMLRRLAGFASFSLTFLEAGWAP